MMRRNYAVCMATGRLICLALAAGFLFSSCQSVNNPFVRQSGPPAQLEGAPPAEPAPPQGVEPAPPQQGLALSAQQRFPDVPLPTGVKADMERTFVYEDKSFQVGRMVYMTKSKPNELANFYIRECPAADWQLTNTIEASVIELSFRKPGKKLKVEIRDLGMAAGGRQLILTMTPDGTQ
ncbi:MAG: hypothetical protein K1Y02_03930 [Candidatus Hydrogenedentes bacterium]|nr:hypothetical protein [Candidatus Hydrogenedentota bacterium]